MYCYALQNHPIFFLVKMGSPLLFLPLVFLFWFSGFGLELSPCTFKRCEFLVSSRLWSLRFFLVLFYFVKFGFQTGTVILNLQKVCVLVLVPILTLIFVCLSSFVGQNWVSKWNRHLEPLQGSTFNFHVDPDLRFVVFPSVFQNWFQTRIRTKNLPKVLFPGSILILIPAFISSLLLLGSGFKTLSKPCTHWFKLWC